jgi:hypothetical protein
MTEESKKIMFDFISFFLRTQMGERYYNTFKSFTDEELNKLFTQFQQQKNLSND